VSKTPGVCPRRFGGVYLGVVTDGRDRNLGHEVEDADGLPVHQVRDLLVVRQCVLFGGWGLFRIWSRNNLETGVNETFVK
jgi:hypothetical protein